jgi:hypothetical protein
VVGIVQVVKSSESSAHVIPATSSRRGPVSINRGGWGTKEVGSLARAVAPLTGMLSWHVRSKYAAFALSQFCRGGLARRRDPHAARPIESPGRVPCPKLPAFPPEACEKTLGAQGTWFYTYPGRGATSKFSL